MSKQKKKQSNYAFIDSQNLNLAIKEQGWTLDYKRFLKHLQDKLNVTKAFLFIGYIAENQTLYTNLQKYGYLLVFKPTSTLPDGRVKGNVDAELVLHSMIEIDNYDQAVVVTGDGDFYCLVEYLDKKKKLLRLVVPNRFKYSSLLRKFTPKMLFLNSLKHKLEYKPTKKRH